MYRNEAADTMLRKASNKLKGARSALQENRYDDCISDSYFACFQSVLSLMILMGQAQSKHQLTRQWVNKELAKNSIIPIRMAKHYNTLMDLRSDADYSAVKTFSKEEALEIMTNTEEFVECIKEQIKKRLQDNKE